MPRRCFLGANGLGFLFQRKPWAKVGQLGLEEWWRKAEFLRVWRASELWITPALKILKIIFAQLPFRQQWVFEINVVWDPMWIMITIQGTNIYKRCKKLCTLASKHQIKIKSLLLSHHHSTSALVSEILMSVLQTVQKKQQTIYIWTDSAKKTALEHLQCSRQCKKTTTIYMWTDSAKKQQTIYIWTDSAKKTALEHLQCSRQCKKNQQQFTYGQYIFTDCTEDNVQNTYTQYT